MNHKLSIIMPCYNCADTLEKALASVYIQDFTIPFEVVMVDDGSTDNTRKIFLDLKNKFPNIKTFFHDVNKGGGAARNTGIRESDGDLLYCLDADNQLAPESLSKMVNYLDQKQCDGVVFYERRFFYDEKKRKYYSHFNKIIDLPIKIENLFDKSDTLLDNFLFTRVSYLRSGGYPEHHGFDTQCYEIRYLAVNNLVYVCPESFFWHRVEIGGNSYFQRVYKNGQFSINFYLIYEDILWLFSKDVIQEIINYDIFYKAKLGADNLKDYLSVIYKKNPDSFFSNKKELYDNLSDGYSVLINSNITTNEPTDLFLFAVANLKNSNYDKALEFFKLSIKMGLKGKIVYYNIFRMVLMTSGQINLSNLEKECQKIISSMNIKNIEENNFFVFFKKTLKQFPVLINMFLTVKLCLKNLLQKLKHR